MVDVLPDAARWTPRAAFRANPGRTAAVLGAGAALISFIGSGNPSYWGDEAASVLSASRSLTSLFGMLGQIDAVHGAYYLFLHFWVQLAGTGEWAVRAPSAVAVGFAAAGCYVLGRRLFGATTGIVAAVLFAVLPQATHMGAEARSYAFTMAAAVWLLVWLLRLLRRGEARRRVWALYGVATAASIYLFLYLGLMLLVAAATLLILRAPRSLWRRWAWSTLLALLVASPILVAAMLQRSQISFLAQGGYATPETVLVTQWFGWPVFAIVAWALIGIAVFGSRGRRPGVLIVTAWLVLPTTLVLLVNAFALPVYNMRYLSFGAPAAALLMAVGLRVVVGWMLGAGPAAARRTRLGLLAGVLIVAALAAPSYLQQRGPYAKNGSDLRQTAEVIAQHAQRGDAIVFDESVRPSQKPRLAIDLYPTHFAGLDDVALVTPYPETPRLWDAVQPLSALTLSPQAARFDAHGTVWVVERGSHRADVTAIEALGYHVATVLPVHTSTVFELTKELP
ncbi:glycosyltransferase family 39 protein [Microterricola viridarii]|uniref:Glycosyltransferase RgtA/B/C/D-like domain-containing protein n=1 Tax=Microterricola viridarii TaxID=412690 RepID=A0A0Y0MH17_9MICO|nr:glycosyltransferase family 39 protein [Microterricola viridarii]AMB57595.1 hypothetical protein AWU67_00540 [Microterricola viridarii]